MIYNNFSPPSICMHVSAVPGSHWLTREFLFSAFDYPFNYLQCLVVVGVVPKKNKVARKFDEHLGFQFRGSVPDGFPNDDAIIYALQKKDCRWISPDFAKRLRSA